MALRSRRRWNRQLATALATLPWLASGSPAPGEEVVAAALLLLFTLPFLYAYGGLWLAGATEPGADGLGAKDLLLVPLPAVLLFPVTFWALRGWKAMTFIKKYPIPSSALQREVL